jgi:hypothetical protein
MKKVFVYALSVVLLVSCASNAANNGGLNAISQNENESGDSSTDIITPSMPEDSTEDQNSFSEMTQSLLSMGGLYFNDLKVTITPKASSAIVLNFTDMNLDLTDSNSLDFNFSSSLNVQYEEISENLNINFEKDGYLYVSLPDKTSYSNSAFSLSAPDTLDDFIKVFKLAGMNIPSTSSLDFDVTTLISDVKNSLSMTSSTSADGGYVYTLAVTSFSLTDSITVPSFSLTINSNSNNQLSGITTISPIVVSDTSISIASSCKTLATSTYVKADASKYSDLTHASESVLSTVISILDKKKTDVGINIALTAPNGTSSNFTGSLKADVSSVSKDLTHGSYYLSLDHQAYSGSSVSDSLAVTYTYPTAYISLNDDQFKGKVSDTNLKDLFSYITSATGSDTSEGFADELATILGDCDFSSLLKGDYSGFDNLITDFSYVTDQSFTITLSALAFGLGDSTLAKDDSKNLITISADFNDDKTSASYGLTDISIKNLYFKKYLISSLSLTPSAFTSIADLSADTSYKNYGGSMPIFKTISDIVKNKQLSAAYDLSYTDSSNSYTYKINGNIDADLTNITSFSALNSDSLKGGKYHISLDTIVAKGSESCDNFVDAYYQDSNIYLGYNNGLNLGNTVFKNYISNTSVDNLTTIVKNNSTDSSSDSLSAMDKIINAIKDSDPLKSDLDLLKSGYLSSFKTILSIDKNNTDTSKIVIYLDVPVVLANTDYANKVGGITITLNADDDSLASITVSSYIDKEANALSFTLTLADTFNSSAFATKTGYTEITSAGSLLQGFYNLPNFTSDKYGIGIDASLTYPDSDDSTKTKNLGIKASAAVDGSTYDSTSTYTINLPTCYGTMVLNVPDMNGGETNTPHTVEFNYDNSISEFTAEYNDKMHLVMHKKKIEQIYSSLKGVTDDQNLLYRYLKTLNSTVSGIPLQDCINNKDVSQLLYYPFIKKVELNDTSVVLTIDSRMINGDNDVGNTDEDTRTDTITVNFTNGDTPTITSATIDAYLTDKSTDTKEEISYSTKHITATISLETFDSVSKPTMTEYSTHKDQFVDMDNFATLVDCLLDTTETNYFHITGSFKFNITVLDIIKLTDKTIDIDARIYVADEHAYAYLMFNNNNSIYVEIFISEKEVLMARTKGSSTEYFKTTQENVIKNVAYYIFTYIIDIDSMEVLGINVGKKAAANIYKGVSDNSGSSSATINNDFSQVINSAVLNGNSFDLDLNLANLVTVNGISFPDSTKIHVGYTNNGNGYTPLTSLTIDSTSLSAYSVVDITVSGSAALDDLKTSPVNVSSDTVFTSSAYMKRYNDFVTQFKSDYGEFNDTTQLPYYEITGYTINKSLFGTIKSYTLQDNASAKKTASSGSVYYYEH